MDVLKINDDDDDDDDECFFHFTVFPCAKINSNNNIKSHVKIQCYPQVSAFHVCMLIYFVLNINNFFAYSNDA